MFRTILATMRRMIFRHSQTAETSKSPDASSQPEMLKHSEAAGSLAVSRNIEATPRGAADTSGNRKLITSKPGDGNSSEVKPSEGNPAMNAAFEKLMQHMDERNVRYLTNAEKRSIWADFRGDVGTYRVLALVEADDAMFQVIGGSPIRVPDGARPAVAETVARANFGLKSGKFEMDVDTGDLRFQVSQILTSDGLEDEVIGRLMGLTMSMLDLYLPAVLSVIYGNELPKDAIRCVEAGFTNPGESQHGDEPDAGA